jgi:hypothetical protein
MSEWPRYRVVADSRSAAQVPRWAGLAGGRRDRRVAGNRQGRGALALRSRRAWTPRRPTRRESSPPPLFRAASGSCLQALVPPPGREVPRPLSRPLRKRGTALLLGARRKRGRPGKEFTGRPLTQSDAQQPCANSIDRHVSVPAPPNPSSTPSPPFKVSFSLPPKSWSRPRWPKRRSAPAAPRRSSTPLPP